LQGTSSNIDASYNWWGTTDTQAINLTIYGSKYSFDLGTVSFVPFLTEPNPEAPEVPELEPTPALETHISISVDASSTVVGSAVNVNGRLTDVNGSALQGKLVTLSYSITGNEWVPIGSGTTNDAGEYNIQWVNTASGTFTLKVEWIGNDDYLGANATTTLSFPHHQNHKNNRNRCNLRVPIMGPFVFASYCNLGGYNLQKEAEQKPKHPTEIIHIRELRPERSLSLSSQFCTLLTYVWGDSFCVFIAFTKTVL